MTESVQPITSADVSKALARIGKQLDPHFTDEYFAGLKLRGGNGDGHDGDRCSLQERRAWERLDASSYAVPATGCPAIGAFMIRFQDSIKDDALRTRLCFPLLVASIGSKGSAAVERRRAWIAADWAIREVSALWLDQSPELAEHAAAVRALPEITCKADAEKARTVTDAARTAAWSLRDQKLEPLKLAIKAELEKRGFAVAAVAAGAAVAAVAKQIRIGDNNWWAIRNAVYTYVYDALTGDGTIEALSEKYKAVREATWHSGAACVERMLAVTEASL